jgi:hypothetical protein
MTIVALCAGWWIQAKSWEKERTGIQRDLNRLSSEWLAVVTDIRSDLNTALDEEKKRHKNAAERVNLLTFVFEQMKTENENLRRHLGPERLQELLRRKEVNEEQLFLLKWAMEQALTPEQIEKIERTKQDYYVMP